MNSSNKRLIQKLEDELSEIRKTYKAEIQKPGTEFSLWLCDNYYVIERNCHLAEKNLKNTVSLPSEKDGLPRCFNVALSLVTEGVLPDTEILVKKLSNTELFASELYALKPLLAIALISCCATACNNEDEVLLSNCIKSFSRLDDIDFGEIVETCSVVERKLSSEKCGIYPKMSEKTRRIYRETVYHLAKEQNVDEGVLAERIVKEADEKGCHVGKLLNLRKNRKTRGTVFLVLEIAIPYIASLVIALLLGNIWLHLLLYLPVWEIFKCILDSLSLYKVPVSYLPRMEEKAAVDKDGKTLIVVSMLLPSAHKASGLRKQLEQLKKTNGVQNVKICALADLRGSDMPTKPEDEADIAATLRVIESLNKKYGGGFILAVRKRVFSKTQDEYTGRERKRGAIAEIIRKIKGVSNEFAVFSGDVGDIGTFKYICALDSDTKLPMDAVAGLTAIALHPLNKAKINKYTNTIESGYGIFAPYIGTTLYDKKSTLFAKAVGGVCGISIYDLSASERYQDLFSRGTFCGKGLIDVDAAFTVLEGAFKKEHVLSHDILEGELLRTAFVSDIEFTDSAVSNPKAWFDRQHRWIRGDWQNIIYLFKNIQGESRKISYDSLSRYKLFDNLRRSLSPVLNVLLILLSPLFVTKTEWTMLIVAVISVLSGGLFGAVMSLIRNGTPMISRRFYSDTLPVAKADLVRAFLWLTLLMQNAWTCITAIVTALYRMLISKKNLLQWTVSADSDKSSGSSKYYKAFLPSVAVGVLLIVFGNALAKALGILYFISPAIAVKLGKVEEYEKENLSDYSKEKLISYAAAMWKYFDTLCGPNDNYLPPDNLQEAPVFRTAHRTSPTNIGLMLVSCLGARDLGFIDSEELYHRVNNTLTTVEKLEKYKGNLLNWYDTETLRTLNPRYASTVDSGNFVCCLVALRQGLLEYIAQCPELKELVSRITRLIADTDIACFYNERRKLFSIGIDADTQKPSTSNYDLFMSEARMTGYYAVSARLVPQRHWGALSRMLSSEGNYTGPLSWTGTMFEFFMPYIFIPSYRGTLGYEALRFCSSCQRRFVRKKDIPFGISESCFYAFDSKLDYQYKANGVPKLALKKGMGDDTVISPYSTFLLLPFQPQLAMKNLQKLEKYDAVGKYGFYEAVDFTPERTDDQEYCVVKCFMAHHIGMSFLSILNVLKDNILQKRFMLDEEMSAGEFLLQEKIHPGAAVFKDVYKKEIPQRSVRVTNGVYATDKISPLMPTVRNYSNSQWSMFISDCGSGFSLYNGLSVNRRSSDILRRPDGIIANFRYENINIPFTRCADYNSKAMFAAEFTGDTVNLTSKYGFIDCSQSISVFSKIPREQRSFSIKNNSKSKIRGSLSIYFEPSLAKDRDEKAHSAFSKMFIESYFDKENDIAVFCRKNRSSGEYVWLAVGFFGEHEKTVLFNRETVLKRPEGIFSLSKGDADASNSENSTDKCCYIELPVLLEPKQQTIINMFILGASCKTEVTELALRLRRLGPSRENSFAPCAFSQSSLDGIISNNILAYVLYEKENSREHIDAVINRTYSLDELWTAGISGDNPIIYARVGKNDDIQRLKPYISLCEKLRKHSVNIDIAIGYDEGGEYGSPMYDKLCAFIKSCRVHNGHENELIHLLNLAVLPEFTDSLLKANAVCIANIAGERLRLPPRMYKPSNINEAIKPSYGENDYDSDGNYRILNHPQLPWCHTLCNSSFGTLVSDLSLGFTYAINSYENKLTPWFNDTRIDNRGEIIFAKYNGKVYDLALNTAVTYGDSFAMYEGALPELIYKMTVTVPEKGMLKEVRLEFINNSSEEKFVSLLYYCEPVTGTSFGNIKPFVSGNGLVFVQNPMRMYSGYTVMSVLEGTQVYTTNRADVLSGSWRNSLSLSDGVCAAVGRNLTVNQGDTQTATFRMSFGMSADSAMKLSSMSLSFRPLSDNFITVRTPDENFDMFYNSLLKHQIISSRILSRSGFYQCGGAFGFRDQLQDTLSLILTDPVFCKRQIIRCAAVQFREGDVLHWWHPGGAEGFRGVRTTCSDDYMWLPLAVAEYCLKTGDYSIINTSIPFLDGEPLGHTEGERYALFKGGQEIATVYEHCKRAIGKCLCSSGENKNTGEHGLILIRGGDWNDGFNKIGNSKRGESIWLTQFVVLTLKKFTMLSRKLEDFDYAEALKADIDKLTEAVQLHGYNGKWYIRAYLRDGRALGDEGRSSCAIDSLSQSFAVFADLPDEASRKSALENAVEYLVDKKAQIVKLFTPPFSKYDSDVGYTSAYLKGVRENGGQYTHAAVWLAGALLRQGMTDEGYDVLKILNPYNKYKSGLGNIYKTEPYALCGDVYGETAPGRGGWSLYTGAAAWYYRTVYELLFGIEEYEKKLTVKPHFPANWNECSIELNIDGSRISISYERSENYLLTVDGEIAEFIPLDEKNHIVKVKFNN